MSESERKVAALLQSTVPEPPESLAPSAIIERVRAGAEAAPRPPLRRVALRGLPPLLAAAAVVVVVAAIATVAFVTRSSGPAVPRPATPTMPATPTTPTGPHASPSSRSRPVTTANVPPGQPQGAHPRPGQGGGAPTGSGSPAPARSSPASADPTASAPSTGISTEPTVCPTDQLTGRTGSPSTDAQGGTTTVVIELDNGGTEPCQLSGAPGAYLVDGSGQQIGGAATPDADPPPADPVVLGAGGAAYFRLVARNATTPCTAAPSTGVVVTPPGAGGSITVPYQFAFCPDANGAGLTVSAIHPTADIP